MKSQKEKAVDFFNLHHSGRILVIPNAWDVPSARIFEEAGFPALATTSGGVSGSLGYPDGQKISRDEMLGAVRRIAKAVSIPVSADMEAGYGIDLKEIEKTAAGVISAGAVGLNIEDATRMPEKPLYDVEDQVRKILAIREVGESKGIRLFINARTDAYFRLPIGREEKLSEVVRRGRAYLDAGADCIFAFGMRDAESIEKVVKELRCPINVTAGRGTPPVPELARLGVARVSIATSAYLATMGLVKRIAKELIETGTYIALDTGAITHEELGRLAVPRPVENEVA